MSALYGRLGPPLPVDASSSDGTALLRYSRSFSAKHIDEELFL
jgi:hypothetical protein